VSSFTFFLPKKALPGNEKGKGSGKPSFTEPLHGERDILVAVHPPRP
jgi:hypothetical protein